MALINPESITEFNHMYTDGYFPLLIKLSDGRRIICYAPSNLPNGMAFKVLETNCNIEFRFTPGQNPLIGD